MEHGSISGRSRRSVRQVAVVVSVAAAAVLASWLLTPRAGPGCPLRGTVLEAGSVSTLDGFPCSLQGYRAVVVVSADCPACLGLLRILQVSDGAARQGIVGVSLSPPNETRLLLERVKMRFPFLLADGLEIRRKWSLSTVPALFLLDGDARVRDVLTGARCFEEAPGAVAMACREDFR